MFGSRFGVKQIWLVGLVIAASVAPSSEAQTARRVRRESSANRKARIQRTIEETYSHRQEVSGGGGLLRFRPGQYLRRSNEVTFYLNDTYYLNNNKLGVMADVHGAYGNAQIGNTIYNIPDPQISEYIFSAGPSYRFYAKQRTAASAFVTGGVGYGKFDTGSKGIPPTLVGIWPAEWRPAFTAGVNLDYNFYPNLAARLTPTYVGTTFGGTVENSLGFNIGLVYRFGHMK